VNEGDWSGFQLAAVAPEPSTWAMMLAGFLAVGFVAKRRARRRPMLGDA
jgi:hypothetical protein